MWLCILESLSEGIWRKVYVEEHRCWADAVDAAKSYEGRLNPWEQVRVAMKGGERDDTRTSH